MGFDKRYADIPGAVVGPVADLSDIPVVTIDDLVPKEFRGKLAHPPTRKDCRAAARAEHAAELARRLAKERQGTAELVAQITMIGLPEPRTLLHPLGQIRLVPERRWRVDVAFEDVPLLIDLQGMGTHSSKKGLLVDTEKACAAAILGVTFMPVTYKFVKDGRALAWIEEIYRRLKGDQNQSLVFDNGYWIRSTF